MAVSPYNNKNVLGGYFPSLNIFIRPIYGNSIVKCNSLVMDKEKEIEKEIEKEEDQTTNNTRTVEFEGCFHRGKSQIRYLKIETYYFCSECREYRKIAGVT